MSYYQPQHFLLYYYMQFFCFWLQFLFCRYCITSSTVVVLVTVVGIFKGRRGSEFLALLTLPPPPPLCFFFFFFFFCGGGVRGFLFNVQIQVSISTNHFCYCWKDNDFKILEKLFPPPFDLHHIHKVHVRKRSPNVLPLYRPQAPLDNKQQVFSLLSTGNCITSSIYSNIGLWKG